MFQTPCLGAATRAAGLGRGPAPRAVRSTISRTRPLLTVVLLLGPVAAAAHARLIHASPGAGASVREAPLRLSFEFSEGVEPAFSSITVANAQGKHFEQGKPYRVGADPSHVAVDVTPLPPGPYTVTWHVTSMDTHKTQGRYQFTVAP